MKRKVWEFKSLFIPTIAIGLVIVIFPFLTFREHPIFTTFYVYIGVMLFLVLLRNKESLLFETSENFDKVTTIITWCISAPVFMLLGLSGFIVVLIWKRLIYRIGSFLSITIIFVFGIKLKIVGTHPKGQFIATPNHCSTVDDLIDSIIMGLKPWKVVYAAEVTRIPFVKLLLKISNIGIPITRTEATSRKEVALNMKTGVTEGYNILIFPEGRRLPVDQKNELLLPFYDGPFLLSAQSGVPILPVVISWTFLFKPRSGQWWFSPRTITIYYLDPEIKNSEETIDEFKNRVRQKMYETLQNSIKEG